MSVTKIRGWLVALAIAAVALTGCAAPVSEQVDPFDLHDTARVDQLSCGQSRLVQSKLNDISKTTVPVLVNQFKADWGVDPQNAEEFGAAKKSVDAQVEKKCVSTPTPSPSGVPIVPEPTPSASTAPVDQDFIVPANDEDIRSAEFAAFVARCGNKLSVTKRAKDDKTDFVIFGKGNAYSSWGGYTCEIARNPTLGDSINKGLINQKVPSGLTFGQVNSWMAKFLAKSEGSLTKDWVLKDTRTGALTVKPEYTKYAFKIVSLLELFERKAETSKKATWHYPALPQADGLRKTYKETKDYVGKFIPLMYTLKGQSCPFAVYGINVADGRFAKLVWPCGVPKTPDKPGIPYTPDKPTTPPHKPKPKPTPKPTPTPKPLPSKTSAPPNDGEPTSPPTSEPVKPRE